MTQQAGYNCDNYKDSEIQNIGGTLNVLSGGVFDVNTGGILKRNGRDISNILDNTKVQASHNYGAAHADWTLSATEKFADTLICTNADAGAAIIAPSEARRYVVVNGSGQAVTIKKSGGTGITIANTKAAIVEYTGTDYVRITADA
jgi:hypothetical protein